MGGERREEEAVAVVRTKLSSPASASRLASSATTRGSVNNGIFAAAAAAAAAAATGARACFLPALGALGAPVTLSGLPASAAPVTASRGDAAAGVGGDGWGAWLRAAATAAAVAGEGSPQRVRQSISSTRCMVSVAKRTKAAQGTAPLVFAVGTSDLAGLAGGSECGKGLSH